MTAAARRHSWLMIGLIWLPLAAADTGVTQLSLIDQDARRVMFPAPVKRLAVVSINQEETLLALQAWDQVVALPQTSFDNPLVRYLQPPPKPVTTFAEAPSVSLESLAEVNPELVLTWVGNRQLIRRLDSVGWPALSVHPKTFGALNEMVDLLGRALGRTQRAARLRADFDELQQRLQKQVSDLRDAPQRVLWLGTKPTVVYGSKWIFHDIIRAAGGHDVAGELRFHPYTAEVSLEQIIAWRPDVIVIVGAAPYTPRDLLDDPRWAAVPAVRAGRVYQPPARRANLSPYATLMAVMTAHWCYPTRLPAVETLALLDEFHRRYYGVTFQAVHPGFAAQLIPAQESI